MAPTFTPFAGLFRGPAALRAHIADRLRAIGELSERPVRGAV